RNRRPDRRDQRPVRLILGPALDPFGEQFLLIGRELLLRHRRRHLLVSIVRENATDHLAVVGMARHNRLFVDGDLALIEPQVGLAGSAVRPMAREAVVEQNGTDVAVGLNGGGASRGGTQARARATRDRETSEDSPRDGRVHAVCLPFRWDLVNARGPCGIESRGPLWLANHRYSL